MRILTTLLTIMILPLTLCAQEVWTEGTEWEVAYTDGSTHLFTLSGNETIDGTEYLKLVDTTLNETIGYIRTERGDTTVYARGVVAGEITDECVLYDFGDFQPGSFFSYSCYVYDTNEIVTLNQEIKADSISYFNDVVEEGDILPCYYDVIFKVGAIGGPMYLFYYGSIVIDIISGGDAETDGPRPRTGNVSHMIFRPKGRGQRGIMVVPTDIRQTTIGIRPSGHAVNLQGVSVAPPYSGIVIINGKKYGF